jgi:hypothetical protein
LQAIRNDKDEARRQKLLQPKVQDALEILDRYGAVFASLERRLTRVAQALPGDEEELLAYAFCLAKLNCHSEDSAVSNVCAQRVRT